MDKKEKYKTEKKKEKEEKFIIISYKRKTYISEEKKANGNE